jgi:ATP-binding cassette subfamily B protein
MTSDMTSKEVRTFSVGAYLLEKYNQIRVSLIAEELRHKLKRSSVETLTTVFATSAFYIVMAYVIFKSMNGGSPVGNIAIFLVVFPQSFALLQGLTNNITSLYQNNIYLNDIFEFLDLKPNIEAYDMESGTKQTPNEKNIHLKNIWFKYPHAEEFVLENVSMELPAGKMIALVGLNGAGKSTLIKLLCRLYDPLDGKIMFNDTDIKDIPIADYRRQISVVFQDFVRYNMVVSENIWFGDIRQEMDMALIKKAAIDSGAASFIEHFPEQYDTMLGRVFDDGHEVSIGQWQKIAIARALYSNSKLVILDEATSALDAIAEKELMERLRDTLGHRSALIISHRLSTIQHADHIYVMGDKKIMEEGTHDTLIAKNGRYAALYKAKIEVES